MKVFDPFVDDLEDLFVLVGLADVLNDILTVRAVNIQHLSGITLILKLLQYLGIDSVPKMCLPSGLTLIDNASKSDGNDDQELLVNVVHQVFEVGVDTGLSVDCGLLISHEMVELDDTD